MFCVTSLIHYIVLQRTTNLPTMQTSEQTVQLQPEDNQESPYTTVSHVRSSGRRFVNIYRHLTYVEDRLQAFESALGSLFPGSDLDSALNSVLSSQDESSQSQSRVPSTSNSSSRQSTPIKEEEEEAAPEALPQQADGFDWAEKGLAVGELTDGMAALSIKPEGAGYFGTYTQDLSAMDHG